MEENNQDGSEVLETTETAEETVETPTLSPEEIKTLQEKAAKADELVEKNKQLFERAKKAEAKDKEPSKESQFSPKDYLALTESKVSSEDFDEVVRVAQILGKSISDALQDKTLKTILAERVEERRTAQATQTGKNARGNKAPSADDLLRKASRGEVPEDDAGIEALVGARHPGKK